MVTESVLLKFTHTIIPWRQCWFQWPHRGSLKCCVKCWFYQATGNAWYHAYFTQYHAHWSSLWVSSTHYAVTATWLTIPRLVIASISTLLHNSLCYQTQAGTYLWCEIVCDHHEWPWVSDREWVSHYDVESLLVLVAVMLREWLPTPCYCVLPAMSCWGLVTNNCYFLLNAITNSRLDDSRLQ